MKTTFYNPGNRQTGFSLVDVMVGMVLGLMGTIIIFQVFEASERIKRTTTGGGDAQQNGVAALFALERGVRQAGYGINASDVAAAPPPVPLAVTAGATTAAPDSITIAYRPSNIADCPATAPNCSWEYGPFAANNNLVFTLPPPLTTLNYCVTSKAQLISRTVACVPPPTATTADPNDVVLVEGVAQLKVQPVVDATGTTAAMQLAIVARNTNPEKLTDNSAPCDNVTAAANPTKTITPNSPVWLGTPLDLTGAIGLSTASDDWRCYRYKVFTVTVPLRNVLWRP